MSKELRECIDYVKLMIIQIEQSKPEGEITAKKDVEALQTLIQSAELADWRKERLNTMINDLLTDGEASVKRIDELSKQLSDSQKEIDELKLKCLYRLEKWDKANKHIRELQSIVYRVNIKKIFNVLYELRLAPRHQLQEASKKLVSMIKERG